MKSYNQEIGGVFKICFSATKTITTIYVLLFVLQGILPSILAILEAKFINDILNQVFNRNSLDIVFINGVIILILIAIKWEIGSIQQLTSNLLLSKIKMKVNEEVYHKKSNLLYKCFENKEICDLIYLTSDEPEKKLVNCLKNKMMLLTDIITVCSFIIILFPILSFKIWILLLLMLPLLKLSVKSGQKSYQISKGMMLEKRKADYLFEILNNKECMEERTTFHYTDSINKTQYRLNNVVKQNELKVKLKWFVRLKSSAVLIAILTGILTIDMFYSVISHKISIGLFISMFNTLNSLIGKMTWQITELTDKIAKDNEFTKDYRQFFNLPEQDVKKRVVPFNWSRFETIELKNVSFRYPNSNDYVLKDFSFIFKKGICYSLIGVNGSGKSTLIKLLLGLYEDYTGVIKINGIDIKTIREDDLHNVFSVVFQDFPQYQLSIDEILSLVNGEEIYVNEICNKIGFQEIIDKMPDGTKTKIGKIYQSNIELSYGQWQKINIMKSLVKKSSVYILDEPTASLDPITELNIYEQYLELKKQETVILISHRLGITKNADTIILLDKGILKAVGNHKDLYRDCKLYKEMFDLQKEWYA